jgi:hypothetical protein
MDNSSSSGGNHETTPPDRAGGDTRGISIMEDPRLMARNLIELDEGYLQDHRSSRVMNGKSSRTVRL